MSRFEWVTDPGTTWSKPSFDVPIYESKRLVALPSLGALVPGWILVIPRRRIPNMSYLDSDERQELAFLACGISDRASSVGRVFCFEHGGQTDGVLSCGVDQAHLHIAPLDFDLVDAALGQPDVDWVPAFEAIPPLRLVDEEYLAVGDLHGRSQMGFPRTKTSQWFRRLIAAQRGQPDDWDYRKHPMLENVDRTARLVGPIPAYGR